MEKWAFKTNVIFLLRYDSPLLSVQFSDVYYIHKVVQLPPLSHPRIFSSSPKRNPHWQSLPVPPAPPALGTPPSTSCLWIYPFWIFPVKGMRLFCGLLCLCFHLASGFQVHSACSRRPCSVPFYDRVLALCAAVFGEFGVKSAFGCVRGHCLEEGASVCSWSTSPPPGRGAGKCVCRTAGASSLLMSEPGQNQHRFSVPCSWNRFVDSLEE